MKVGVLPLGRPTFDVPFAEENLRAMRRELGASGHEIIGPETLLMDPEATRAALEQILSQAPDRLLILQVTFTDAAMTMEIAGAYSGPLALWAIPEPRLGGRLRLNSLCGLNLAAHALSLAERPFSWCFGPPGSADLAPLFAPPQSPELALTKSTPDAAGALIAAHLRGKTIARIGQRPEGFHTCDYDAEALYDLAGVRVAEIPLSELFETASAAEDPSEARRIAEADVGGLKDVDQGQLTRSLKLKSALGTIRAEGNFDAFALRCWPETFTEYGGAICGPAAQMGEARVPCACEADVYGALTQLALQEVAGAPVFLADLVDIDGNDDTGVLWHCGQAPVSMADPAAKRAATIHTNRKMPLLYEFPLRPGRVTLFRISQSAAGPRAVILGGEMLARPMAFTGTSGVIRFDRSAAETLSGVIASGLEHHTALAYGDHRGALRALAGALELPVLEI